jgi:enediyne biosynthesis protein E4
LKQDDSFAEIMLRDGTLQKIESYYGNGYLSQSSRQLRIPLATKKVFVINYLGQRREIDF